MTRALEQVAPAARRCIPAGTSGVAVSGEFEGRSGEYRVTHVASASGAALSSSAQQCVREAVAEARVRPFREAQVPFGYTFATPLPSEVASTPPSRPPAANAPSPPASCSLAISAGPSPVELIRREGDALQRCYEQACERDHTLSGTIELHFLLDGAGRVTQLVSRVNTPHEDVTLMELVARCIESHVRLIPFGPQAQPGNEIVVPLAFDPSTRAH
jgi:hypothetical protein